MVPRLRRKFRAKYYKHIQHIEVQDTTLGITLTPAFVTSFTQTDGTYAELWAFLNVGDVDIVITVIERAGRAVYEVGKQMGNEATIFLDGTPVLNFPKDSNIGYGAFTK